MFIVTWNTESGDEGVEGYWEEKPTDHHLETYFRKSHPQEFESYGRLIFWEVHELQKLKMPRKSKKVTPTI